VTLSGFAEPFDTWADMGHLLPREAWRRRPRALAYFCGVLPDAPGEADAEHPGRQRALVRENAIGFLNGGVGHLWPNAVRRRGGFRWELLAIPAGGRNGGPRGEARFDLQHWTANVNPSDRYTLALPGSAKYRISPLDPTYDNFTVCGDWTDCGFNSGCVEAAVMSGRLAAHALTRTPALEDIVGFDHP
jgi:Flavin containing amine oxidoreductase